MNATVNTPAASMFAGLVAAPKGTTKGGKVSAEAAAIAAAQLPGCSALAFRKAIWSIKGGMFIAFHGTPLEVAKKPLIDLLGVSIARDGESKAMAPVGLTLHPLDANDWTKGGQLVYTAPVVAPATPADPKGSKTDKPKA